MPLSSMKRVLSGLSSRLRARHVWMLRVRVFLSCPNVTLSGRLSSGPAVDLRATDGGRIQIGDRVVLSRHVEVIAQRGSVTIGDGAFIGPWTLIVAKGGVSIGRDCLIAERVTIRDQDHRIHRIGDRTISRAGFEVAPVFIGDGVWIGAGAVVLRGVSIGRGAVVAANAVVTRDVREFEIVGGIPAKVIGMREVPRE